MTGYCKSEAKTRKQTIFRQDLFGNFYSTSNIIICNETYKLDRSQLGMEILELCASFNDTHISVNVSQCFLFLENYTILKNIYIFLNFDFY